MKSSKNSLCGEEKVVFRNQDLSPRSVTIGVPSPSPSACTEQGNICMHTHKYVLKYIHSYTSNTYTHLHLYLFLCLSTYKGNLEFTLTCSIPICYYKAHSSFPPSVFISLFSRSEKLDLFHPQYSTNLLDLSVYSPSPDTLRLSPC